MSFTEAQKDVMNFTPEQKVEIMNKLNNELTSFFITIQVHTQLKFDYAEAAGALQSALQSNTTDPTGKFLTNVANIVSAAIEAKAFDQEQLSKALEAAQANYIQACIDTGHADAVDYLVCACKMLIGAIGSIFMSYWLVTDSEYRAAYGNTYFNGPNTDESRLAERHTSAHIQSITKFIERTETAEEKAAKETQDDMAAFLATEETLPEDQGSKGDDGNWLAAYQAITAN